MLNVTVYAQDTISFYFESGKFELSAKENDRLTKWMLENSTSKILAIHGFTDEVGTTQANDTLSQNRVNFIFNKVYGKVNIREDFKTISYGEKFQRDVDQAKNRRASIFYLKEKDLSKENQVLGIEEEIVFPENATLEEKVALAKVGTKIVLKNINFYQNTFAITPELMVLCMICYL